MSNEGNERLKRDTQHVSLKQNTEEKVRGKGLKSVWDDANEINRGSGMEGREERFKGIEIHTADVFAIIKPTTPFKLAKHET